MPPTQREIEQQRAKAQAIKERAEQVKRERREFRFAGLKVVLEKNKITARDAKETE